VTTPSLHSKTYAPRAKTCARKTTVHLHPSCARRPSLRASDRPDKTQHQLSPKVKNPNPMLHIIQHHLALLHTSSWVMIALALRTSLILVVGFHAVYRCTTSGVQADSKSHIPGITMKSRVDIFTKVVITNPQTAQPKCPNQICDLHPD